MIEELGKNPWLIEDVLSDVVTDPLLSEIYGQKEVDNAKEWFKNNKIAVVMKYRKDQMQFPCVTIAMGSSSESESDARLADQSTEVEELTPEKINKPIPYVIKPFPVTSYALGVMALPEDADLSTLAKDMLLMDPATGDAFPIKSISNAGVEIEGAPALTATKYGIIPQYRYFRARREMATFTEAYTIGCHVGSGDPAPLLWLHSIVLYGLLRYRESLFEARGYQISSVSSTDFVRSTDFEIDRDAAFSRWINMSGKVENTWLKTPQRVIESTVLSAKDATGVVKRIKIMSNLDNNPAIADDSKQDSWGTVNEPNQKRTYTKRDPK